jgi:hypothetical protein
LQGAHFVDEAGCEHGVDTARDAGVELFARQAQGGDGRGVAVRVPPADGQGAVRVEVFEGADEAARVGGIGEAVEARGHGLEGAAQGVKAFAA